MLSFTRVIATVSLLAAAARAIQVTSPTKYQTWTTPSTETVTWSSVSTDPSTIALILISFDQSYILQLSANTTTSDGTLTIQGTFPVGNNYRVNIVRDATQTNSILAQSDYFNITQGATTSSSASSTAASSSSASSSSTSAAAIVTLSKSASSALASATGSAASAAASAASASALANAVPSTTSKASSGSRVAPAVGLALVGAVGAYFL